jgi:DNA-binding NarL/FixJ family response regulator
MTQPLALLLYEKLLPGTQLVNRLQDLGWRVETLHDAAGLTRAAEEQKPILVLTDLSATRSPVCDGISHLRQNKNTAHIPVIAFAPDETFHKGALDAGATLVVSDTAVLQHLNQFIDKALSEF